MFEHFLWLSTFILVLVLVVHAIRDEYRKYRMEEEVKDILDAMLAYGPVKSRKRKPAPISNLSDVSEVDQRRLRAIFEDDEPEKITKPPSSH